MTSRLPHDWVPPVAARQAGLFTAQQAVAAGATPAQVRRRRDTGRWVGVLGRALAPAQLTVEPWLQVQAVALTWPDAVVALRTAAAVHRLPVPDDGTVHVIVPRRVAARSPVVAHRLRLDRDDVVAAGRGRVTSLQRTLFDCVGRLPSDEADSLVAWSTTRRLLSPEQLEHALGERPRWWGNTARRRAVLDASRGTLSAAERRLRRILRSAKLTGWAFDQPVHDTDGLIGRADVLFAAVRLVLEVDGFAFHSHSRFQYDRTRQNRLVAAGYAVLRFTWADLTERPDEVAAQVTTMVLRLSDR